MTLKQVILLIMFICNNMTRGFHRLVTISLDKVHGLDTLPLDTVSQTGNHTSR